MGRGRGGGCRAQRGMADDFFRFLPAVTPANLRGHSAPQRIGINILWVIGAQLSNAINI